MSTKSCFVKFLIKNKIKIRSSTEKCVFFLTKLRMTIAYSKTRNNWTLFRRDDVLMFNRANYVQQEYKLYLYGHFKTYTRVEFVSPVCARVELRV